MKDFTNKGGTGTITGGSPIVLGAPLTHFRFYTGRAAPEQHIEGGAYHSSFRAVGQPSGGAQPWDQVVGNASLLCRSKINCGVRYVVTPAASFDTAGPLENPYRSYAAREVTEPMAAQTLSGSVTVVLSMQGPTSGLAAMAISVQIINAAGTTTTPAGFATGGGLVLSAARLFRSLTVAISGAVEEGGRVEVGFGAAFADNGSDEAVKLQMGTQEDFTGPPQPDGVDGDTDGLTKVGHVTFSNGLTIKPTQWAAGNDTPGTAWDLGTGPVRFGPLDVSKSPGCNPGSSGSAPFECNSAWFTWTADKDGEIFIDTRGSNYHTDIDVFRSQGQTTSFPDETATSKDTNAGRGWDSAMWTTVAGRKYWIGVHTHRNGGTAYKGGGALRLNMYYREAPLTDDLYIGARAIYVYRKNGPFNPGFDGTGHTTGSGWSEVNHNNNLSSGFIPTGMHFDYGRTGVVDNNVGGSPPSPEPRVDLLLTGLFFFPDLVEAFNAVTLNGTQFGQSEYNALILAGSKQVGPGADLPSDSTSGNLKMIPMADKDGNRVQGEVIVSTEGDNYDFFAGLSSAAAAGFWRVEALPDWWFVSLPNFASRVLKKYTVELENQSTDHFDIMPDLDTILYTSAGQRVLRYRMSDEAQLSDFVSVPSSNSGRPGARGIKILPDLSVIVVIGSQVHHYSAAGALIKTMNSNDPARHQALERVVLDSTGRFAMVVDVIHSDVLEFDLITGQHIDTIWTGLPIGQLCGIACYRGFEAPPPPPPPDPPPGEPPNTGEPPSAGLGTFLPIRRQRAAPHINDEQTWIFYSRLQIDLETGVGLVSGQGVDPQIMMDYSDDGGHTWCNEQWRSAGLVGDFKRRCLWRRLGRSRDRIYRITVSDPVKWAFVDAYITANGGTS